MTTDYCFYLQEFVSSKHLIIPMSGEVEEIIREFLGVNYEH